MAAKPPTALKASEHSPHLVSTPHPRVDQERLSSTEIEYRRRMPGVIATALAPFLRTLDTPYPLLHTERRVEPSRQQHRLEQNERLLAVHARTRTTLLAEMENANQIYTKKTALQNRIIADADTKLTALARKHEADAATVAQDQTRALTAIKQTKNAKCALVPEASWTPIAELVITNSVVKLEALSKAYKETSNKLQDIRIQAENALHSLEANHAQAMAEARESLGKLDSEIELLRRQNTELRAALAPSLADEKRALPSPSIHLSLGPTPPHLAAEKLQSHRIRNAVLEKLRLEHEATLGRLYGSREECMKNTRASNERYTIMFEIQNRLHQECSTKIDKLIAQYDIAREPLSAVLSASSDVITKLTDDCIAIREGKRAAKPGELDKASASLERYTQNATRISDELIKLENTHLKKMEQYQAIGRRARDTAAALTKEHAEARDQLNREIASLEAQIVDLEHHNAVIMDEQQNLKTLIAPA